jgi:hypothetical protein
MALRLLRTVPRLIFLAALALMVYSVWNPYLRAAHAQSLQELWAFQRHALEDFLQAPQWHAWMLWPTVIFAGFAAVMSLPGYFWGRRTKWLLMWGTPARAVITSFAGGTGGVWWHLEYPDADGNVIKTTLLRHSTPDARHSVLTVLYNPAKPHDLITYPVPQYRVSAS